MGGDFEENDCGISCARDTSFSDLTSTFKPKILDFDLPKRMSKYQLVSAILLSVSDLYQYIVALECGEPQLGEAKGRPK